MAVLVLRRRGSFSRRVRNSKRVRWSLTLSRGEVMTTVSGREDLLELE